MKTLKFILTLMALLIFYAPLDAQTIYKSNGSGTWATASIWLVSTDGGSTWSTATSKPGSGHDVTVQTGHIITLNATESALNLTVQAEGVVKGDGGGTVRYLRTYGTLTNNGTIGGTPSGTSLALEPALNSGTVSYTGSGTYYIYEFRPYNQSSGMTIIIDQDMTISRPSGGRGLIASYQNSINNTLTINAGKTVTLLNNAYFHLGSATSDPDTGGNTTYNINGTLNLGVDNNRFILIPFSRSTSVLTININGTVNLGSQFYGQHLAGQMVWGPIKININNEGSFIVTGTPSVDITDVDIKLSGTGYIDFGSAPLTFSPSQFIKTTGTGGLKRNVGTTDVTFPVGSATTYNPVVMSNSGIADKFSVRVKSTFDNPPVDPNKVVNRQWTIDEDVAGGSNAIITLQWNLAEEALGFNRSVNLLVSRYNGSGWIGTGAALSGTDPYTATASCFNQFSNFIVESRSISSFQLSSSHIEFSNVNVSIPKTDSIYARNIGSAAINVSSVLSDDPLFSVTPSSAIIPAGDSTKFKITFTPVAAGPASGNITFTHDGGGSPHTVTVSGTGVYPAAVFSVDRQNIAFGAVGIGKSKRDSVLVTNIGGSNLVIDSVRAFNSDFSVNPSGPVTILPAANQKFYITFAPTTMSALSGNLRFYSNVATSPDTVALTGTGMFVNTVLSNGTGGGVWSSTGTWQGAVLPSIVDSVVILGADSVFLSADVSTGGLHIQANGRLRLEDTLRVINGKVNGTVIAAGASNASALIPSGTMIFENGSLYRHSLPGGIIPPATWNSGSTCEVTGYTSGSKPGNPSQNFYHFVWNCPSQTANVDMAWYNNIINGDITIKSTGTARMQMTSPSPGTPNTITVNGNVIVEDGQFTSNGSSGSADITVYTYGNINVTGGNFSISRGSGPNVDWYLYSNFSISGGATTQNSKPAGARFIAAGTTPQNINFSGMTFNGTVPVQVNNGSTVNVTLSTITYSAGGFEFIGTDGSAINMGTSVLQGTGAFTLNGGATLVSAHVSGLNGTLSNTGTLTLNSGANYMFNGTLAQVTGSKLPATLNNLTINNTNGVTISASATVNGTLSLLNGDLTLGSNVITLGPSGTLNETAGNTVWGKIVTNRTLAQSVNNTFGGLGLEINAAGVAPGSTDVERVTGIAQTGGGKYSILRFFNITPTVNSGLNATFVFKYDNSELNGQNANTLQLFKSVNAGASWTAQGGTPNAAQRTITLTGVNSFSRWTAADENNNLVVSGLTFGVAGGWNMISVPLTVADYRKSVLFPLSTSNAFMYSSGYVPKDTLENGLGYWLKFGATQDIFMGGTVRSSDSVSVAAGWNMIGSISEPIRTVNVTASSGIFITSQFYGYQNGYQARDTIYPGKAYWVKVSGSGKLYFNSGTLSKETIGELKKLDEFNSITVTDAAGSSQTLYFGVDIDGTFPVDYFELPPRAPEGVFDVRYNSERIIEVHSSMIEKSEVYPIGISSAVFPITISWNVKSGSSAVYELCEGKNITILTSNGSIKLTDENIKSISLKTGSPKLVPTEFTLGQNYPNPFNPSTTIRVGLPVQSNVILRVYDLLGQQVSEVATGIFDEGYHNFAWSGFNSAGVPAGSGVYFYKIDATSIADGKTYTEVRKMILMK